MSRGQENKEIEESAIQKCLLDAELYCPKKTGLKIGRPLLTLLIDTYSKEILSGHLSLDPLSERSTIKVLQECVKTYSKLPKMIVLEDSEVLLNEELKQFAAKYQCKLLANSLHP